MAAVAPRGAAAKLKGQRPLVMRLKTFKSSFRALLTQPQPGRPARAREERQGVLRRPLPAPTLRSPPFGQNSRAITTQSAGETLGTRNRSGSELGAWMAPIATKYQHTHEGRTDHLKTTWSTPCRRPGAAQPANLLPSRLHNDVERCGYRLNATCQRDGSCLGLFAFVAVPCILLATLAQRCRRAPASAGQHLGRPSGAQH